MPSASFRRQLLTLQWQNDTGVAKAEGDRVAIAGNDYALAYFCRLNRPIVHGPAPNRYNGTFPIAEIERSVEVSRF